MTDSYLESLVDRFQPETLSRSEDLDIFLCEFLRSTIRQITHEKAGLGVSHEAGEATIKGYLPYPAACSALDKLLDMSELSDLSMTIVPACSPESSSWFLVGQGRIRGFDGPDPAADVAHIWEPGDPIRVLREDRGYLLCQASDGYLSWTEPDSVLETIEKGTPHPDASPATGWKGSLNELKSDWLGVPYVWGGTGKEGVDCSGLTMRLYRASGLQLPRDSHQQMLGGRLVATYDHRVPLAEGDLLFFTHDDGCIGHVAISLGGWRVLHAQEGGVCEFSLDPADSDFDPYRAGHFVLAKRWLESCA